MENFGNTNLHHYNTEHSSIGLGDGNVISLCSELRDVSLTNAHHTIIIDGLKNDKIIDINKVIPRNEFERFEHCCVTGNTELLAILLSNEENYYVRSDSIYKCIQYQNYNCLKAIFDNCKHSRAHLYRYMLSMNILLCNLDPIAFDLLWNDGENAHQFFKHACVCSYSNFMYPHENGGIYKHHVDNKCQNHIQNYIFLTRKNLADNKLGNSMCCYDLRGKNSEHLTVCGLSKCGLCFEDMSQYLPISEYCSNDRKITRRKRRTIRT